MKILYAARNNYNSKIQLERFLEHRNEKDIIKIAGYKDNLPSCNVNWTLDACFLPDGTKHHTFENNDYLNIYESQIIKFAPDLIISDLEIYTSYLAIKLGIRLWHYSNKMYYEAIDFIYKKSAINAFKYYFSSFKKEREKRYKLEDLFNAADKNFVCSHFCDIEEKIILKEGFEYIRPYHYIGKKSAAAEHKYISVDFGKFDVIKYLSGKDDCILFSESMTPYDGIIIKNYKDKEEYKCNLANCDIFVCSAESSLMADAFYNNRKIKLLRDQPSKENIFNYLMYHRLYEYLIEDDLIIHPEPKIDKAIKFLHEKIEELH